MFQGFLDWKQFRFLEKEHAKRLEACPDYKKVWEDSIVEKFEQAGDVNKFEGFKFDHLTRAAENLCLGSALVAVYATDIYPWLTSFQVFGLFSNQYLNFFWFNILVKVFGIILASPVVYYITFYVRPVTFFSCGYIFTSIVVNLASAVFSSFINCILGLVILKTRRCRAVTLAVFSTLTAGGFLVGVAYLTIVKGVTFKSLSENYSFHPVLSQILANSGFHESNVLIAENLTNEAANDHNAMMFGIFGKYKMLLRKGTVDLMTGAELSAVVAHELGHYMHGHSLKRLLILTMQFFCIAYSAILFHGSANRKSQFKLVQEQHSRKGHVNDNTDTVFSVGQFIFVFGGFKFFFDRFYFTSIQAQEYQADLFAVNSGLADELISNLQKHDSIVGNPIVDPFVNQFTQEHPSYEQRLEAVKKARLQEEVWLFYRNIRVR